MAAEFNEASTEPSIQGTYPYDGEQHPGTLEYDRHSAVFRYDDIPGGVGVGVTDPRKFFKSEEEVLRAAIEDGFVPDNPITPTV